MSVFGGDSWAREAQHRKRRVDELISDTSRSSHKKLSNGKLACLVCPNTPVLDSPLALSLHCKGSRHVAAEARLTERERHVREEKEKRIALSGGSGRPLVERATKAVVSDTVKCEGSGGGEVDEGVVEEWRKRSEMELRFVAAGWRKDFHGKWYKDENAEFDSDEEDPNSYFS